MSWWAQPVAKPSEAVRDQAKAHQVSLTKPAGSLGRLEHLATDFAAWQDTVKPTIERITIRVFAGDHGVAVEGVSAFPQSVTRSMLTNFINGGAAICVLAKQHAADFSVVDIGVVGEPAESAGVIDRRLASGTANFLHGAAMSHQVLDKALEIGREQVDGHADLFIGGEMGIGNSTVAAALTSAFLQVPAALTVGAGTGIDDARLQRKLAVVDAALALHNHPDNSPLETLRCLGGLEIAALTGAYIASAQNAVPALVDGYVSNVAALAACRLNPGTREWLLFAHRSSESGHQLLLDEMSAVPLLDLGLHLGEASGAALAIPLLRSACELDAGMATFETAQVASRL